MSKKNKTVKAIDLLVSLFNCNPEDIDYLMHLINKVQDGQQYDTLSSLMDHLNLDCTSYNLKTIIDEIFFQLGCDIFNNIMSHKIRGGGRSEITIEGAKVKDKTYKFDLSIIECDYLTLKSKQEIVDEFNTFLEKKV